MFWLRLGAQADRSHHWVHMLFLWQLFCSDSIMKLIDKKLSNISLVIVVWLFLTVPWVCLQFVIVVFPDHTHLLFLVITLF